MPNWVYMHLVWAVHAFLHANLNPAEPDEAVDVILPMGPPGPSGLINKSAGLNGLVNESCFYLVGSYP